MSDNPFQHLADFITTNGISNPKKVTLGQPVGFGWKRGKNDLWLIVCAECKNKYFPKKTADADIYVSNGDSSCDYCGHVLD